MGQTVLREWLQGMISTPSPEYPEFPAALSFLPSLTPSEAIHALTTRISQLTQQLASLDDELAHGATFLPRLLLIESEYQHRVVTAELDYVRGLTVDLRNQSITWPHKP